MTGNRRGERGASMVEFAIVLPVFLTVVLAGMSLLWVMAARTDLAAAAKAGARYAAIPKDPVNCQPDEQPCSFAGYADYPNFDEVTAQVQHKAKLVHVGDRDVSLCHRNDGE